MIGAYDVQKIMIAGNHKFIKIDGFVGLHYNAQKQYAYNTL